MKQRNILAVGRYSFDDEYPGWHASPKCDRQIEIAFKWMEYKNDISLSNDNITKLETTIETKQMEHNELVKDVKNN